VEEYFRRKEEQKEYENKVVEEKSKEEVENRDAK
jgi:hypothetical protein